MFSGHGNFASNNMRFGLSCALMNYRDTDVRCFHGMFIALKGKTFNTECISLINSSSKGDMHCIPVQATDLGAIFTNTQNEKNKKVLGHK